VSAARLFCTSSFLVSSATVLTTRVFALQNFTVRLCTHVPNEEAIEFTICGDLAAFSLCVFTLCTSISAQTHHRMLCVFKFSRAFIREKKAGVDPATVPRWSSRLSIAGQTGQSCGFPRDLLVCSCGHFSIIIGLRHGIIKRFW
jgi:hypothetical protein